MAINCRFYSLCVSLLYVFLSLLFVFLPLFSSSLKPCVEFILIKVASYSSQLCTQLLTQLLYGRGLSKQPDGCLAGSLGVTDSCNSENELLYQLGILQDDQAWSRLVGGNCKNIRHLCSRI